MKKLFIVAALAAATFAGTVHAGQQAPKLPACAADAQSFTSIGIKAVMDQSPELTEDFKREVMNNVAAQQKKLKSFFRDTCNSVAYSFKTFPTERTKRFMADLMNNAFETADGAVKDSDPVLYSDAIFAVMATDSGKAIAGFEE